MTGGRRRWLLAGVAAIVALVCWGGVALVGSLLSSPTAPAFAKSGSIAHASAVVQLAQLVDRTNVSTPADDQYGNPLQGKLCADPPELDFAPPRVGDSVENGVLISNCGDVPVTVSPPRIGNEDSPFHLDEGVDSTRQCPPLAPGDSCLVLIIFPGIPSRPPGDYSDTLTLAGDNASVTVQLRGTVPPHTPGDEQYGNPLIGKLCAPAEIDMLPGMVGVGVSNCSDATITLSPLQRSNEDSPFLPFHDVLGLTPECPFEAGQSITLAPRGFCALSIVLPLWTPPGDYSDDWTFPGDKASVTVHLSGTVPNGLTTFFVSAFNSPDLSPACAAGPVDAGIDLAAGQEVVVTASGSATWFFPNNGPNGPDGDTSGDTAGQVGQYVPTGAIAALIGRVGSGDWMEIGSGPTTVTGPGELRFAFDDAILLCDNTGGFTVNVHFQVGP